MTWWLAIAIATVLLYAWSAIRLNEEIKYREYERKAWPKS